MKQTLRTIALLLLVFMAVPMMAQTETPEKETQDCCREWPKETCIGQWSQNK